MGRDEEFREFYVAELAALRRLAYRLTGDWHEAEELAQDAMVRTYRSWGRVREREAPAIYARAVLMNKHRSLLRRMLTEAKHRGTRAPEPAAADPDEQITIWHELARLPVRQRQAVVLHYYEDLPQADIAAVLGCPPGTVNSLVFRGLARLRARLAEHGDEPLGSEA